MNKKHTVSIVIPVWDRTDTIQRAINSCVQQTRAIDEIIVIDDGSTDSTAAIVKEMMRLYPNIKYFYQENSGTQKARNYGLSKATSDLIGFLDSDDEYLPDKIALQEAEMIASQADIVSCYSKRVYPDGSEKIFEYKTEEDTLLKLLREETYVTSNSALFKKECFEQIQFDIDCPSSQEWELHINMAQHFKYSYVPKVLSIYNMNHSAKNIYRNNLTEFKGLYYILMKYKCIWIEKTGRTYYYTLSKKLLVYRWLNSKGIIFNFFKLIKLDKKYVVFIFKPLLYKHLIKSLFTKREV